MSGISKTQRNITLLSTEAEYGVMGTVVMEVYVHAEDYQVYPTRNGGGVHHSLRGQPGDRSTDQ